MELILPPYYKIKPFHLFYLSIIYLLFINVLFCIFSVNDALLHDLASQLGMDWFNLGLRLSLQPGLLEELRDGITVPVTEKPLRTLERWRAIRPPKTREIPTLCQALTKCSRNDLVQMVRQENREDGEKNCLV